MQLLVVVVGLHVNHIMFLLRAIIIDWHGVGRILLCLNVCMWGWGGGVEVESGG